MLHINNRRQNVDCQGDVWPSIKMISIIDDDLIVREATADLLSSLGYTTFVFESAEQFLKSDRIGATRCVIVDVQMPGLSGLDLQDYLRSSGYRTPIIFITGFPTESARSCALNGGAIAFLSKPFEDESLIKSLEIALSVE